MILRLTMIGLAIIVIALTYYLPPPDWRAASISILGGLSGIAWAFILYLDETAATQRPARTFTLLYFAILAFTCLAASEIVPHLTPPATQSAP